MSESEQLTSNFAYHTGRVLGKYQLSTLIGRGGMAEIYKSYHPDLERDLAVKILYPHFTDLPGFVERFRREAQTAATLRHPNIVQIFDFARTKDGLYYMVLEYIDGQSLESFLTAQAPLTLSQTLVLFRQIASAIQYAHERGLIHRDIKPANILLDKRGQAYLTDFGIAQIMGMTRLTQTDTKAGTPIYMAPEQIETQPVSVTADVYSLGMLLYKMLTNRLPYENENPSLVLMQKLMKPPTSPRQYKPNLPVEIEEILMIALAREPEKRFPDVVSMTWALEDAYGTVSEGDFFNTAVAPIPTTPGDFLLNRLDHYEIQEPLTQSETNASQRYVGHNHMLNELVLLEVMKATDEKNTQLFLQRMTTVSQLAHPHIAPVAFINQIASGYSYAALAYKPGMTLAAKMEAEVIPSLLGLYLARQLAHALRTIHAINLIHGDLEPETVFVGDDGGIWLMGLGIVAEKATIHDNIKAFGHLLQRMLPQEALSSERFAASIVSNCLKAGVNGYDSMTDVCIALDEALGMELDRKDSSKHKSYLKRFLPIIAGVIFVLALLAALVVWQLGSEVQVELPSSTLVPTSAPEATTVQLKTTSNLLSPTMYNDLGKVVDSCADNVEDETSVCK